MARLKIDLPEKFVFSTNVPIRLSDINRSWHLGHDAILPIMEEARTQFFISVGYPLHITKTTPYIMTDAAIVYEKQGHYGQTLKVEIAVTDFTDKGCDLLYRLSDADDGTEIVRAKTGILFFDYQTQKVVPVPVDFRNRFSK